MKHLKVNNETYLSHLKFACNVGVTLITRGVIFVCHGLFPFCEVPKRFNLEETYNQLKEWNNHAEARK